jgi:hypothetical protein
MSIRNLRPVQRDEVFIVNAKEGMIFYGFINESFRKPLKDSLS